jgi:hypothetical protein
LEWRRRGINESELVTLCCWCHSKRHHVLPHKTFERDGYACTECRKKADEQRDAKKVLTLHFVKGSCCGASEKTNGPADFVTLCHACHNLKHPDKVVYHLEGGEVVVRLPDVVEQNMAEFEITLPIISEAQFARYKCFLQLVSHFIVLFRKQNVPQLTEEMLQTAGERLGKKLVHLAAEEAIKELNREPYWNKKDLKKLERLMAKEREVRIETRRQEFLDYRQKVLTDPWRYIRFGRAKRKVMPPTTI